MAEAARVLERAAWLDRITVPAQRLVAKTVSASAGVRGLLAGTWLGHPLHPLLTDVVIGSWTSAWILDVAGGRDARRSADRLLAVGTLSVAPTVATGLWVRGAGHGRQSAQPFWDLTYAM